MKRVVITGLGTLTGYGRGTDALWKGLSSGKTALREHSAKLGRKAWMTHCMAALPDGTRSLGVVARFEIQSPYGKNSDDERDHDDPDYDLRILAQLLQHKASNSCLISG